jgi:hypothetical protein
MERFELMDAKEAANRIPGQLVFDGYGYDPIVIPCGMISWEKETPCEQSAQIEQWRQSLCSWPVRSRL